MANTKVPRPTHAFIGYATYEIRWLSDEKWKEAGLNEDWGGISEHELGYIGIRMTPGRIESSMQETLTHELIHAIWAVAGINHAHFTYKTDTREEMIVTQQAPGLLFMLRNNPHVLAYLLADPEDVKR